ncbi:Snaclec 9 [Holothuria leucospilota]|uniref:Snaclec 9 n=1 Tax=Holothuria leucospilota TaxID=206669 RepID=A0A9Q1H937_HOLLE|nr:Snaclec 9 [Holothuria leucospilota]
MILFHLHLSQTFALVLFLIFFIKVEGTELECREPFVYFQKYCYYFSSQQMPFRSAKEFCNSYGFPSHPCHLTSIHSSEENSFVHHRATQLWANPIYWLGATKSSNFGYLSWLDRSWVNFTKFRPFGNEGWCVQQTEQQVWDDTNCAHSNYFVCKKVADIAVICKYFVRF